MASGFLASEFLCNGFNDLDIVTVITCKLKCGKQRWYGVFFMMICMSKNQENSAWLTSRSERYFATCITFGYE